MHEDVELPQCKLWLAMDSQGLFGKYMHTTTSVAISTDWLQLVHCWIISIFSVLVCYHFHSLHEYWLEINYKFFTDGLLPYLESLVCYHFHSLHYFYCFHFLLLLIYLPMEQRSSINSHQTLLSYQFCSSRHVLPMFISVFHYPLYMLFSFYWFLLLCGFQRNDF